MGFGLFFESWAETFFFILLVLGFVIAIMSPSAVVSYIVIFCCGLMGGRLIYHRRGKMQFPIFLIIIGFMLGFLIGALYGERKVMIILFILGTLLGYYLFEKGVLYDRAY